MHAILQEYLLDVSAESTFEYTTYIHFYLQKISRKLHLSKFKLNRFNESGQLVFFYLMSFLWGADVMVRDGFFGQLSLLWKDHPNHPMSFLHKLFFIIQLAYYLHMLPELYFQKVKREDQNPKIVHSVVGFLIVGAAYYFK